MEDRCHGRIRLSGSITHQVRVIEAIEHEGLSPLPSCQHDIRTVRFFVATSRAQFPSRNRPHPVVKHVFPDNLLAHITISAQSVFEPASSMSSSSFSLMYSLLDCQNSRLRCIVRPHVDRVLVGAALCADRSHLFLCIEKSTDREYLPARPSASDRICSFCITGGISFRSSLTRRNKDSTVSEPSSKLSCRNPRGACACSAGALVNVPTRSGSQMQVTVSPS